MEAEEWWEVPPPPPPPPSADDCSGGGALHYCPLEGGPMGAHFNRASFPSLPIIAVCSSVVLVAVLVATFLLWRHKTKVQNLLPCKNEQQGHLGELGAANGITYEDVLINRHPTRIPQGHLSGSQTLMPLEILDVKLGDMTAPCYHPGRPEMVPPLHHHLGGVPKPSPFHHPVYEEVSQAPSVGGDKSKSYETDTLDDEFPSREGSATSSVRGSTGGDLCRDPASSDEGGEWGRYASQENIYSTIDEDQLPLPPSLARDGGKGPPLSQRAEEGGSSYGDMMPAFHSATFM